MNPVDHVSICKLRLALHLEDFSDMSASLTVVVTINTLVKPRQSLVTPHKVKRPVLLPPGEPVCCVVLRRSRIRHGDNKRVLVDAIYGLVHGNDTSHRQLELSRLYLAVLRLETIPCQFSTLLAKYFQTSEFGDFELPTVTLAVCCAYA